MLANSDQALSPKAKVTYDEDKFVVELPMKDYRVSFHLIFLRVVWGRGIAVNVFE
jgi:hypothetical protein